MEVTQTNGISNPSFQTPAVSLGNASWQGRRNVVDGVIEVIQACSLAKNFLDSAEEYLQELQGVSVTVNGEVGSRTSQTRQNALTNIRAMTKSILQRKRVKQMPQIMQALLPEVLKNIFSSVRFRVTSEYWIEKRGVTPESGSTREQKIWDYLRVEYWAVERLFYNLMDQCAEVSKVFKESVFERRIDQDHHACRRYFEEDVDGLRSQLDKRLRLTHQQKEAADETKSEMGWRCLFDYGWVDLMQEERCSNQLRRLERE